MSEEIVRVSSGTLADYSVREVGRAILNELDMLRNRIAELSQAVGLITTLKPTMVMDADHPLEMAKEVVEHVTARIAELEEFKMIVEGCGFEVITEPPVLNHPERKILKGHGTIYVPTPPEVQE